jgi:hypothetical protein
MRSDPAAGRGLPRRCGVVLALALAALLAIPGSASAEPVVDGPRLVQAPGDEGVATTTSTPAKGPTGGSSEERRSRASSLLLPLVLAAIVFLAVLGPRGIPHTHHHWHSG